MINMPTVCNICTVMFKGVYALKKPQVKKEFKVHTKFFREVPKLWQFNGPLSWNNLRLSSIFCCFDCLLLFYLTTSFWFWFEYRKLIDKKLLKQCMNAKSQINWVLCYITFDDICCRIKRALNFGGMVKT